LHACSFSNRQSLWPAEFALFTWLIQSHTVVMAPNTVWIHIAGVMSGPARTHAALGRSPDGPQREEVLELA